LIIVDEDPYKNKMAFLFHNTIRIFFRIEVYVNTESNRSEG